MKKIYALIAGLGLFVAALFATAAPASAGGSGDFYKSRYCYAVSGATATDAVLRVTNYDKGTGQEYHWSMVGDGAVWELAPYRLTRDGGIVVDGSSPREGYIYFSNKAGTHSFKGEWRRSGGLSVGSCTIGAF